MAILDQSYQAWTGELQPRYRRIGAMVRVGIRTSFAGAITKFVLLGTYALMFGWMGLMFIFSTLHLGIRPGNEAYRHLLGDLFPMGVLVMTLAALVGAKAIAHDLRHNAVSMYFSKAFTRPDYLISKFMTVAAFLLSATLVPAVCLWIGHWAVAPAALTTGERLSDLLAIVAHSVVLVAPIAAYVLALSSWSRSALVPGILWVMTYLGSHAVGAILFSTVRAPWCKLVSWPNLVARLGELLYVHRPGKGLPIGHGTGMTGGWEAPAAILAAITILSAALILWRLRKFEGHD